MDTDIGTFPRSIYTMRIPTNLRLLHEGDLLRCFRNSASVTYVSTLPSASSSGLASHPSFKVSAHLRQICENGTSCNILNLAMHGER